MDTIKSEEFAEDALSGKQKAFLKVLEDCLGVVSSACAQADVARSTFYKWKAENETFAAAVADVEELVLDVAEGKLHELIEEKSPVALIFFLKCKGKKRGYTEKTEIQHSGRVTVEVRASELPDDELATIAAGGG